MAVDEKLLREALSTRDRLLDRQHEADVARAEHHDAVRRLHAGGASMREIAESLGLSHQRIHQIVGGGPIRTRRRFLRRLTGSGGDCAPLHPEVLERFAPDAREALWRAEEEARSLGHDYVGTEHLLLALIGLERGLAPRILVSLGVDLEQPRRALMEGLWSGDAQPGPSPLRGAGHVPMTARARSSLDRALKEARRLRSVPAGEHVLLGIVGVREAVAARVLSELGVDEKAVRDRLACADRRCSFCARDGLEVDHIVAGPGVFICDRCVEDAGRLARVGEDSASCSFCGRRPDEAGRLVGGPDAVICDDCLALCGEIHHEERRRRPDG